MNFVSKVTKFLSLNLSDELRAISKVNSSEEHKRLEVRIMNCIVGILALFSFSIVLVMQRFWSLETSKLMIHSVVTGVFYLSCFIVKDSSISDRYKVHYGSFMVFVEYLLLFYILYDKISVLYWFMLLLVIIPISTFSYTITVYYMVAVVIITGAISTFFMPKKAYLCENAFGLTGFLIFLLTLLVSYFVFVYYKIMLNESEQKNKALFEIIYQDVLTKLPNRQYVHNELIDMVAMNIPFYVVYFDINDFKAINDSINHQVGDKVLITVAHLLQSKCVGGDFVARIGGDEFIYVVKNEDSKQAVHKRVDGILKELRKSIEVDNYSIIVSVSCGIAGYPEDAVEYKELLKAVDLAFDESRSMGKNKVVFYRQEMSEEAAQRVKFENHLAKAIERKELFLMFQPIVMIKNGTSSHFEALLRWDCKELGRISPNVFISVAEELGLIHDIGLWVFRKACTMVAQCNKESDHNCSVSINVSAIQLKRADFIGNIQKILEETGVSPSNIIAELTESAFVDDNEVTQQSIEGLRALGIGIAIDDFGTGYSSFGYLTDLQVDFLKIDKVFIDGILHSDKNSKVVKSIVSLGHTLGLKLIAEGVETLEQSNCLREMSCDYIQGYYYSKPLLERDLVKYLNDL